jgi:hypothetical protein
VSEPLPDVPVEPEEPVDPEPLEPEEPDEPEEPVDPDEPVEPEPLPMLPDEPELPELREPFDITSIWDTSPVLERLARTWSPSLMSVREARCPSFVTCVDSFTLSVSESSFLFLSNFWTLPVTCWPLPIELVPAIDPEVPVPDVPVEEEPIEPEEPVEPLDPIEPDEPDEPVPWSLEEPVDDEPAPIDPDPEVDPEPVEPVLPVVSRSLVD